MSASGTQSARELMMNERVNQLLQERMDQQQVEYAPGFQAPKILDYYTKPVYTE